MSQLKFNPNAEVFVPKKEDPKGVVVLKSARYMGSDNDYNEIKDILLAMNWHHDIKCVYVTNGWHEGFEPARGGMVTYCGYAPNVDSDIYKQHHYK